MPGRGQTTVIAAFSGPDGASPWAALLQTDDGVLLGTTATGGASAAGVVFRLDLHALPPAPPAVVAAPTGGGQSVRVAWKPVATATSYTVTRAVSSRLATIIATGITDTSFVDTTVVRGQIYHYSISAVNDSGESVASYDASILVGRPVPGDFNGD